MYKVTPLSLVDRGSQGSHKSKTLYPSVFTFYVLPPPESLPGSPQTQRLLVPLMSTTTVHLCI